MSVYALDFGTTRKGLPTHLYRLTNANGMEVDITDVGASIVAVRIPTKTGELVDVALGFDEAVHYEHNAFAVGGVVGRCANRIAGAQFELDGRTHELSANDGTNALHGGRDMWFERLWEGATIGRKGMRRKGAYADTVIFGLLSPDGDQGFPGAVDVRVTYRLTDANELEVTYDAQPNVRTVINLTNHAYWNLNGHDSGSILEHTLRIVSDRYMPVGPNMIPNRGEVDVAGTPFDFREPKPIAQDFDEELRNYDHNFVLDDCGGLAHAATLTGNVTGIALDVLTDMPGIQVYTAQEMDGIAGKDGAIYGPYAGVALETQHAPDAIHQPTSLQPVYSPEEPLHTRTVFRFRA